MPVVGSGSLGHRVVTQSGGQVLPFVFGQQVQDALGLRLGGQDAFDGVERIGAEADGPLQSGEQVLVRVGAQECQHFAGLGLTEALRVQQAVEEAQGSGTQFGEAFAEQGYVLAWVGVGPMSRVFTAPAGLGTRQQPMAGDLLDARAVDDQARGPSKRSAGRRCNLPR